MSFRPSSTTASIPNRLTRSSSHDPHPLVSSSLPSIIQTAKRRDDNFSIGSRSSYERSERVGDRKGRDFYQFKLSRSQRVQIRVTNREFLFGPSLELRLEKRGSSSKINRTALPLGTAIIDRRFSQGNYTLRVSSNGDSVPYRLVYRRRSDDRFDFFD
ncbi:MAG TPA: hypothetical protein V6C65_02525 [Allocoleopsis sp.]